VSNVLNEEKRQQVLALGRLGWPLRRIEKQTGVRRETASAYLKAAGIAVRSPRGWGKGTPLAKPAKVSPDFGCDSRLPGGTTSPPPTEETAPLSSKPAKEVSTDPGPDRVTASACEAHRDFIELSLSKAVTPRPFIKTWSTIMASPAATPASSASFATVVVRKRRRRASSLCRRQAKSRRLTTAPVQWCAIRTLVVTVVHVCSYSRSATVANVFAY
jgi:hypothetical protein